MLQTIREKTKLLNRVRCIRGQVEAVERALEQEIGCADVLQLITAARGAINGLMGEVIEDHIRIHLVGPTAAHHADEKVVHFAHRRSFHGDYAQYDAWGWPGSGWGGGYRF